MLPENQQNKDRMRQFAPRRSGSIDNLIDETEQQIANTKLFLERLQQGEEETRRYIEELKSSLENDLRRLERTRRKRDGQ